MSAATTRKSTKKSTKAEPEAPAPAPIAAPVAAPAAEEPKKTKTAAKPKSTKAEPTAAAATAAPAKKPAKAADAPKKEATKKEDAKKPAKGAAAGAAKKSDKAASKKKDGAPAAKKDYSTVDEAQLMCESRMANIIKDVVLKHRFPARSPKLDADGNVVKGEYVEEMKPPRGTSMGRVPMRIVVKETIKSILSALYVSLADKKPGYDVSPLDVIAAAKQSPFLPLFNSTLVEQEGLYTASNALKLAEIAAHQAKIVEHKLAHREACRAAKIAGKEPPAYVKLAPAAGTPEYSIGANAKEESRVSLVAMVRKMIALQEAASGVTFRYRHESRLLLALIASNMVASISECAVQLMSQLKKLTLSPDHFSMAVKVAMIVAGKSDAYAALDVMIKVAVAKRAEDIAARLKAAAARSNKAAASAASS